MHDRDSYHVNLFRPKSGYMVDELSVVVMMLVAWAGATFGFQFLLAFLAETPGGNGLITRLSFFNLPFHFWFTGQFLPLWFIILCALFNLYIDRLTERHSRKRERIYE